MKDLKEMNFYKKMFKDLRECNDFRSLITGISEDRYIVAGGSLTDAFLSEENNKEIKPNDIDIFIVQENKKQEFSTARSSYNGINAKYGTLKDVKRKSIYNIIEINPTSEGKILIEKEGLLSFWKNYIQECFDINCCMLFLDFKNDELIYTKSFNEFLEKREMKIVGCLDLFNSFIRAVNKAERYKDYNVKFYKEKWLEVLFYFNCNVSPINLSKTNRNGSFFINLDKIKDKSDLIEILEPMFIVQSQFVDYTVINPNWLSQSRSIYEKWNKMQQSLYSGNSYNRIQGIMYDIYNKNRDEVISMMLNILSGNPSKKERQVVLSLSNIFNNDEVFYKSYTELSSLLNKDYSFNKLSKVIALTANHNNMKNFSTKLLKKGYSVNCILDFLNSVNCIKTYKHIFIGMLETLDDETREKLNSGKELFELLYQEFLKARSSKDEKLVEKISIGAFKYHHLIEEINYKNRLEDEGHMMNHCVGGYSSKIKRKICRVFHLKYKNYESTLEVMLNTEGKFYIRQHYTHMNRTVNKLQKILANSFIKYLNDNKEFEHKIEFNNNLF